MTDADTNTNPQPEPTVQRSHRKYLVLVAIAAVVALGYWTYQRSIHVYTDDARVSADMVVISSKVSGRIEELAVKEGA